MVPTQRRDGRVSHSLSSPHWKIDRRGPEGEQLGEREEVWVARGRRRRDGDEARLRIERDQRQVLDGLVRLALCWHNPPEVAAAF